MEKTRFKGAVFATASALLYGLGAALIKLATKESMSVATLLVGRGGCGMLLLLLAGCIRRKPPAVKLRSLPKIAQHGVFDWQATQIFLNLAYLYLPVGTVTTIHFVPCACCGDGGGAVPAESPERPSSPWPSDHQHGAPFF